MKDQLIEYLETADLSRAKAYYIAEHFGMSYSTFKRRLGETEFHDLVIAERKRRVLEGIHQGKRGWDLTNLAGYSERQTFYRAFASWFGVPYSRYVERVQ